MLNLNNSIHILIIILSCMIFTAGITFLIKKVAVHIGAMDMPNARKVHTKPMPRLGGVGIFLGFLFGYMLFGQPSIQMNSILIAGFVILLTGIVDDIKPIKAKNKLILQIVVACIVVFYGNIILDEFTLFNTLFHLKWLAYPTTILFIVACINIINLIDGLDGLSSGVCGIFYLTIGIIAFMGHSTNTLGIVLAFIMLGSTLGFLYHNFYPAKIFSGDSGSMFQGFMISVIALLGFKTATFTSLIIPLMILAIPILDTLFAIIRRLIKKQPVYMPDKSHLHHQLLKLGLSHRNTVLAIYGMNLLFSAASIIFFLKNKTAGIISYIAIFILVVWIVTRTSIIVDRKEKIDKVSPKKQVKNKNK